MIKLLLVFLLAFATALTWYGADGAAARDRDSSSSSNSSSTSDTSTHSDQDKARDAVRKGKIMPLTAILEIVAKREPGTVMEVELETKRGKLIYRLEVLTDSGRRREIRLDARNGDVLWAGDD
ncbi:MAG TPA: PepSY domain-containing protein [Rhizomicrobium sp.]|nr:PepSY domain-containing protein [Rhizomicrobium sp.]HKU63542.1 PepSY domain-containing protein [Rhizomicrobium sp.]